MIKHIAVKDAHYVRNAVSTIHHHSRRRSARVERQHGLRFALQSSEVELLEHDLRHLSTILLGIQRRLGEHDAKSIGGDGSAVVGVDSEFSLERVLPDLLHIVPVLDDAVFDGVCDVEGADGLDAFVPDEQVLPP